MNDAPSPIVLRSDGTLDLEGFPRAGVVSVARWLRLRLLGQDPYLPTSPADDEPPYNLVVDILQEVGSGDDVSITLAQAVLRLLEDASSRTPEIEPYLPNLLAVCERVRLPAIHPWFIDQLQMLAALTADFNAAWPDPDARKQIVRAATLQAPGDRSESIRDLWSRILTVSEYCTIALFGFGSRFGAHSSHLDTWWLSCSESVRDRELRQILSAAILQDPVAVQKLAGVGAQWDRGLRSAIDKILADLHQLPVFSRVELPMELVAANRILGSFLDDRGGADRISPVLKSRDILLVKSFYTGIPEFQRLHSTIYSKVHDLKANDERVLEAETSDFRELTDPLTTETKRILYTFPMYLTDLKRTRFSVLAYGRQRELGVLVPSGSTLLSLRTRFEDENDWNLANLLQHIASNAKGVLFCLANYATSEIAIQCMTHNPDKCAAFTADRLREVSVATNVVIPSAVKGKKRGARQPRKVKRLVPADTSGHDWAFLFDLGSQPKVEAEIGQHTDLRGCEIIRIRHDLDIPVGIGLNLYLVPWLLQRNRWQELQRLVLDAVSPLAESLRHMGIEFGEGPGDVSRSGADIDSGNLRTMRKR